YLDNTDTQLSEAEVDAFVANNGYLTSFAEVDGDITNEIQDISLVGTSLSITDGSTVDLSSIQDGVGTDEQSLSLVGTDLSISNGNTVDLNDVIEPLQILIDDLTVRIEYLEAIVDECCESTKIEGLIANVDKAILYQNVPNPWGETTTIEYYLPFKTDRARIEIRNAEGKLVNEIALTSQGKGHIIIGAGAYSEGMYFYTLIVDDQMIDTKRFVLTQ
ncbi:MAG: T9SS type A sorting domain-containing protein, partial [Bacteroidales bacterium]|nr:T9SS type A sorting domain-containing protein [Bacteroidales bacterium]